MISLSCGACGNVGEFDRFCRTPVYGDLPPGQFQCPACGFAWRRVESEHRILRFGEAATLIPGKVQLLALDGRL